MNTPFFSSLVSRYPAFSAQNGWKDTEQLRELALHAPAPLCPQRQHTSCARSRGDTRDALHEHLGAVEVQRQLGRVVGADEVDEEALGRAVHRAAGCLQM